MAKRTATTAPQKDGGRQRAAKKGATEFADNVESVRKGWSIRDLKRVSECNGPGQVIDITGRLPPRRGLLNQCKTRRNLNELLGRFGSGGVTTDAEKNIIYSVASAHMEKEMMSSARAGAHRGKQVDLAWQRIWRTLPNYVRKPGGGGSP